MNDKCTEKNAMHQVHRLPAGLLPGDVSTELFGDRSTKKVYGLSNGKTFSFADICPAKRALIFEMLLSDDQAMADLGTMHHEEALERFAFCIFGAADHEPDFDEQGNLGKADNFLCSGNCQCLKWASKSITINGNRLTRRQIEVVTLLATDKPDKQIADELGVAESTLSTHKTTIYELAGVNSRAGLMRKATEEKVIQ